MARTTGLGDTAASRLTARKTTPGITSALIGRHTDELPLDRIGGNPGNPSGRVEHDEALQALAESISAVGVLLPVLVVPATEWATHNPGDALGDVDWVIVDGHRRAEASRIAGLSTVPYLVRSADIDPAVVMVNANSHRRDLTPIEAATTYAALMERHGWGQRELQRQIGVPQATIAKRVALLRFPPGVQALIDTGRVDLTTAARALAEKPTAEELDALEPALQGLPAGEPVDLHRVLLKTRRDMAEGAALKRAKAQAANLGMVFAKTAREAGLSPWEKRLDSGADLTSDAVIAVFNPDAAATDTPLTFYRRPAADTGKPIKYLAGSTAEHPAAIKAAGDARVAAAARVLTARIDERELITWLHRYTLQLAGDSVADGRTLAHRIADHAQVLDATTHTDTTSWWRHLRTIEDRRHARLATWAIVLGACEAAARHSNHPTLTAYVRLLVDLGGYTPSAWETRRLTP